MFRDDSPLLVGTAMRRRFDVIIPVPCHLQMLSLTSNQAMGNVPARNVSVTEYIALI